MIETVKNQGRGKVEFYRELRSVLETVLVDLWISNLANVSAMLFQSLDEVNWAGFYLVKDRTLFLGPFQGKPACLYIPFGKGVCGNAAETGSAVIVADVNEYSGHIACDSASRSEIVIPIFVKGRLVAILDVDSPVPGRFNVEDQNGLEAVISLLVAKTKWPNDLL